jgi:hypothetical protein
LGWIKECINYPRFYVCLSGTLVGYFEGKKGLRQGDPLSLYLFVLVMEVFSRLMAMSTGPDSGFKFHPKCLKLKLTHLCFVDDLLIFSEASLSSINVIKDVLVKFEELSGLKANPSKSSFYYFGISKWVEHTLLNELQMKGGLSPCEIPWGPFYFF